MMEIVGKNPALVLWFVISGPQPALHVLNSETSQKKTKQKLRTVFKREGGSRFPPPKAPTLLS